ncbi:MAG: hypothetical protein AB7Q81_08975 [Gammaproteobacteria bacterium]
MLAVLMGAVYFLPVSCTVGSLLAIPLTTTSWHVDNGTSPPAEFPVVVRERASGVLRAVPLATVTDDREQEVVDLDDGEAMPGVAVAGAGAAAMTWLQVTPLAGADSIPGEYAHAFVVRDAYRECRSVYRPGRTPDPLSYHCAPLAQTAIVLAAGGLLALTLAVLGRVAAGATPRGQAAATAGGTGRVAFPCTATALAVVTLCLAGFELHSGREALREDFVARFGSDLAEMNTLDDPGLRGAALAEVERWSAVDDPRQGRRDLQRARLYAMRVLDHVPGDPHATFALALGDLLLHGRASGALARLQALAEAAPTGIAVEARAFAAAVQRNDPAARADVLRDLESLTGSAPDSPWPGTMLGRAQLAAGAYDAAARSFAAVLVEPKWHLHPAVMMAAAGAIDMERFVCDDADADSPSVELQGERSPMSLMRAYEHATRTAGQASPEYLRYLVDQMNLANSKSIENRMRWCRGDGHGQRQADRAAAAADAALVLMQGLLDGDFAALNARDDDLRTTGERSADGRFALAVWFDDFEQGWRESRPEQRQRILARVDSWIGQSPAQVTPHLVKALLLIQDAWIARGDGYATELEDWQTRRFADRIGEARRVLERAPPSSREHPHWYVAMETVALAEGWGLFEFSALLHEAMDRAPDYHPIYFVAASYFQPHWHGSPTLLEEFIDTASTPASGPPRDELYARIQWAQAAAYGDGMFRDKGGDWQHMKRGFEQMLDAFPGSMHNLNAFAYFACRAEDDNTLADLAGRLDAGLHLDVWGTLSQRHLCLARVREAGVRPGG